MHDMYGSYHTRNYIRPEQKVLNKIDILKDNTNTKIKIPQREKRQNKSILTEFLKREAALKHFMLQTLGKAVFDHCIIWIIPSEGFLPTNRNP